MKEPDNYLLKVLHTVVVSKLSSDLAKDPNTKYNYQFMEGIKNPILKIEIEAGTGNARDSKAIVQECINKLDSHPQYAGQGWRNNMANELHKPCYQSYTNPNAWVIYAEREEVIAVFGEQDFGTLSDYTYTGTFQSQENRINSALMDHYHQHGQYGRGQSSTSTAYPTVSGKNIHVQTTVKTNTQDHAKKTDEEKKNNGEFNLGSPRN